MVVAVVAGLLVGAVAASVVVIAHLTSKDQRKAAVVAKVEATKAAVVTKIDSALK